MIERQDQLGLVVGEHALVGLQRADERVELRGGAVGFVEDAGGLGPRRALPPHLVGLRLGADAAGFDFALGPNAGRRLFALQTIVVGLALAVLADLGEDLVADLYRMVEAAKSQI